MIPLRPTSFSFIEVEKSSVLNDVKTVANSVRTAHCYLFIFFEPDPAPVAETVMAAPLPAPPPKKKSPVNQIREEHSKKRKSATISPVLKRGGRGEGKIKSFSRIKTG